MTLPPAKTCRSFSLAVSNCLFSLPPHTTNSDVCPSLPPRIHCCCALLVLQQVSNIYSLLKLSPPLFFFKLLLLAISVSQKTINECVEYFFMFFLTYQRRTSLRLELEPDKLISSFDNYSAQLPSITPIRNVKTVVDGFAKQECARKTVLSLA